MAQVVESIQLVMFLRSPSQKSALTLWTAAIDAEPTGFNTISENYTQAQGTVEGAEIVLLVQQNRVDVVLQGVSSSLLPSSGVSPQTPALEDPDRILRYGLDLMGKLSKQINVSRVATVIQAHYPADDMEASVLLIKELIPSLSVPDKAQDFTYQVGMPKISTVAPHRTIKIMCKWQTVNMQLYEMHFGGNLPSQIVKKRYAAQLYIDVFIETPEVFIDHQAFEALQEVAGIANKVRQGGYNELI